jgi:hypothetical protein
MLFIYPGRQLALSVSSWFPTEKRSFQEDHILTTKGAIFLRKYVPFSVLDAFTKL